MAGRILTDLQEEDARLLYLAGNSERQVAGHLGVSRDCIRGALRRQGVRPRTREKANRLYSVNGNVFDVIDTEHKAYFLGLLYADGCVVRRSLEFSQNEKDSILTKRLKMFLQSEHPIKETVATCDGKQYAQAKICITDKHLADRLRELGILPQRPSHKSTVIQIPTHLHRHFVRGFFDGDGCAQTKPGLSFVGRLDFMKWVQGTVGTESSIYKHPKSRVYYLRYASKKRAMPVVEFMYYDATTWLERKRNKILAW